MKVRGGGGGHSPSSHRPIVHWLELILAKFLYKVLLYDNNQTGEILNWKLVKLVAGMAAIWREEISGN